MRRCCIIPRAGFRVGFCFFCPASSPSSVDAFVSNKAVILAILELRESLGMFSPELCFASECTAEIGSACPFSRAPSAVADLLLLLVMFISAQVCQLQDVEDRTFQPICSSTLQVDGQKPANILSQRSVHTTSLDNKASWLLCNYRNDSMLTRPLILVKDESPDKNSQNDEV
eukprot:scpid57839/ scgid24938/ 